MLILGFFVWRTKIQPLETLLPKEEATSEEKIIESSYSEILQDWKTYTNEEYGFEIKYPEDWGFREIEIENPKSFYEKYRVFFETLTLDETGAWLSMTINIADNPGELFPPELV